MFYFRCFIVDVSCFIAVVSCFCQCFMFYYRCFMFNCRCFIVDVLLLIHVLLSMFHVLLSMIPVLLSMFHDNCRCFLFCCRRFMFYVDVSMLLSCCTIIVTLMFFGQCYYCHHVFAALRWRGHLFSDLRCNKWCHHIPLLCQVTVSTSH